MRPYICQNTTKGTFYSTIGLLFWRRYIQVDKIYQMKISRCYH